MIVAAGEAGMTELTHFSNMMYKEDFFPEYKINNIFFQHSTNGYRYGKMGETSHIKFN